MVSVLATGLRVSTEARGSCVTLVAKAFHLANPERLGECAKEESKAREAHELALSRYLSAPAASTRRRELGLILARERHELARFDLAALLDEERVARAGGLSSSAGAAAGALTEAMRCGATAMAACQVSFHNASAYLSFGNSRTMPTWPRERRRLDKLAWKPEASAAPSSA